MLWVLTAVLLATLGIACGPAGTPEQPPAAKGDSVVAPVTYTGQLPCADCPGILLTLTLLPDSAFRLRQVYQDRPGAFHRLGRWSVEENDTRLALREGEEAPRFFELVGADSLRPLDSRGQPVPSSSLARAPQVDPVRDTMRLRGMFTYMADAGRFTECGTGSAFPVAQVGDNAALERAYGEARSEPGNPLLVSVRGHFEERLGMEGDRRLEHVVVDSFDRVWPGATCEERMSGGTLENSYWRLLEIGGRPRRVVDNIPEPHLLLHPAQARASGSTGCNQFSGPYQLSGDSLRFGQLISTLRACVDLEMNRQERAFLDALTATRGWRVTGDTLVLTGEAGPVATFAVQYLR